MNFLWAIGMLAASYAVLVKLMPKTDKTCNYHECSEDPSGYDEYAAGTLGFSVADTCSGI